MAKGKKRGHRMPTWRRIGKTVVNLAFKFSGLGIALSPVITGAAGHVSDPQNIPGGIALEYGYDVQSGGVNTGKAVNAAIVTAIGLAVMKIGGYVARSF